MLFLLVFGVILLIITFFYKQAFCDFRINQLEWSQRAQLSTILSEYVPVVVRGLPSATFWTREDVRLRSCYTDLSIFQDVSLPEWISTSTTESVCPWKDTQAAQIAAAAGMPVWDKKWIQPSVLSRRFWMSARYHCWAGRMGLQKLFATWTMILPVEGTIVVSILPDTTESALPASWRGRFPAEITAKDTPFLSDIKYMDIVVRPGSALFLPAHWFVSWVGDSVTPFVCTASYHSPVSLLAYHASPISGA